MKRAKAAAKTQEGTPNQKQKKRSHAPQQTAQNRQKHNTREGGQARQEETTAQHSTNKYTGGSTAQTNTREEETDRSNDAPEARGVGRLLFQDGRLGAQQLQLPGPHAEVEGRLCVIVLCLFGECLLCDLADCFVSVFFFFGGGGYVIGFTCAAISSIW